MATRPSGTGLERWLLLASVVALVACPALATERSGATDRVDAERPLRSSDGTDVIRPSISCASLEATAISPTLIGLPTAGVRLISAALVPAAAPSRDPVTGAVIHSLPEYCKVLGEIDPVDPRAPAIRFQLNVPTDWNRGIIQVGGGGLNGSIPANLAVVRPSGSPVSAAMPPDVPYPLSRGYAMFGGDSGHQGTGGEWALNDEAWLNFAHAGLKKTHDAAFTVVERLQGRRPRVSYFMGSSQGGREALEVAQRYPDDYDGVMATVPLIGYSAHVVAKTLYATQQIGAGWIPPEAATLIAREVVAQCDGLDGLADGVIGHYLACNDRFAADKGATPYRAIHCPEEAATVAGHCLTDAQISTAIRMRSPTAFGFELANGISTVPPYGTGREHTGWLNIAPQPAPGQRPNLGQPGTTVQFGILKDPAADLLDFSIAAHRERIREASWLIDSTNPDLTRFFGRGGRLIVKSSTSDYSVNPQIMARYYESVVATLGQERVDRHLRYYVLPNTGHAGDGASLTTNEPIPHRIDMIGMLTDWVERELAPADAPVLSTMSVTPPYDVSATRPMCRYPYHPHYQGGDPRRAESFRCTRS